jgi:hypothetical protein
VEPRRRTRSARTLGAIGLVLVTATFYWLLTDQTFRITPAHVTFEGLTYADDQTVRDRLADLDRGPNAFRVRASDIVAQLSDVPELQAASAVVILPAEVRVSLDERRPIFVWRHDTQDWLVDEDGLLFAPTPFSPSEGDAAAAPEAVGARAFLPIITDGRTPTTSPTAGARSHIPPIDLSAMRQLLAVDASMLGEESDTLQLRVDPSDGYVLESKEHAWSAYFGHYFPTLQPPEVIPRQVQCLRWLLGQGYQRLAQIRLVVSGNTCGTFIRFGKDG